VLLCRVAVPDPLFGKIGPALEIKNLIRIRIEVKIQELHRLKMKPWRLKMKSWRLETEPRRVFRPVVADFVEEQDPDPH
jgi:hypothetical protein